MSGTSLSSQERGDIFFLAIGVVNLSRYNDEIGTFYLKSGYVYFPNSKI